MPNINFEALMSLRRVWNTFKSNHPKFTEFLNVVQSREVTEGTTVDVTVTYPDGKTARTHVSLRASDLELLEVLRSLR